MLGWLKKKAGEQSLFNVEINTRTLIVVSNKADHAITQTGSTNPNDIAKVVAAQRSLLADIQLALDNGMSLPSVRDRIEAARKKEQLSTGAEQAISHVLTYVERAGSN